MKLNIFKRKRWEERTQEDIERLKRIKDVEDQRADLRKTKEELRRDILKAREVEKKDSFLSGVTGMAAKLQDGAGKAEYIMTGEKPRRKK